MGSEGVRDMAFLGQDGVLNVAEVEEGDSHLCEEVKSSGWSLTGTTFNSGCWQLRTGEEDSGALNEYPKMREPLGVMEMRGEGRPGSEAKKRTCFVRSGPARRGLAVEH